ncbi:MAG: hypothetical protein HKN36_04840 [Hellea sp.]|nr:hypothetical protein [Hellea sp.]
MRMLTDWTEGHSRRFQRQVLTFRHDLESTGLFSDEALIRLLEKHPSEMLDVCSMDENPDPRYPNQFLTGDFRDVPGKTLLDAAKAGRVWINVRKAMNIHREYKAVLDQMYGELTQKSGRRAFNAKGGILISSPISQTPYHFDKTQTLLWHIRGQKRLYIYPLKKKFISDEDYEAIITNALLDDLPYDESFDQEAKIIDLEPGQAACWKLNAPHRVDNQSFCVSVTTEYSTLNTGIKNANMIANAALRSKFGMTPSYEKDGITKRVVKTGLGVALRKMGYVSKDNAPDMVRFKIDPEVKGFVVPTQPFERNF